MASPSLSLLNKGVKKAQDGPAADEAAKEKKAGVKVTHAAKAAKPAPEAVSEEVDVDALSSEQLDALVKEHEVKTPPKWASWDAAEKRHWLKSQFEETGGEAAAGTNTEAEGNEAVAEEAGKSKKTPAKLVKKLSGEIIPPDKISDTIHEIENLNEKDAKKLVASFAESAEFTYFKLGGVLSLIQDNGWYAPYASFREFVEKEHGINYRRAMYWVSIYKTLSENKVPWEGIKHLGWTKLAEIAGVLTPENVEEWVQTAEKNTVLQLHEIVANQKKLGAPKSSEDQEAKVVVTITFKAHEDQKATIKTAIAKAKEEAKTEFDTTALEFICLDYLGAAPKAGLKETMVSAGIDTVLKALEEAFPTASFTVDIPEAAE